MTVTVGELMRMDGGALTEVLRRGHPIDPAALDDSQYKGTSLGLPAIVERLTWKKFRKTFHRDLATGHLRGWNVRVVQNGLDRPCTPRTRRGAPATFGHYRVVPLDGYRLPFSVPHGLMLDYGLGGNGRLDPTARLRDPLVAVEEGSVALLVGWSYVDAGLAPVGTPSFFCLEREGALDHVAHPRHAT